MRKRINLRIVGTGVELDENGFPRSLQGDIFYVRKGSGAEVRAGSYSEDVEPILDPDLKGTRGRSRLELEGGAVVTENLSLLEGTEPDGTLRVRSEGTVVEAEGPFEGSGGTLRSESRFRLHPFQMEVEVTLRMGARPAAGSRSRRRKKVRPEEQ
jgi:hypothetical protein